MSDSSLSIEALFGDLDLELAVAPRPDKALPGTFAVDAEATLDRVGFTSASCLLSDNDQPFRATSPYDIPADEFAQTVSMWGDDERFSAMLTTPLCLEELPPDAYPTQFNVIGTD